MANNFIDRTNERFGRLLVLRRGPATASGASWVCQCDCGTIATITAANLKSGQKSCRSCADDARGDDLTGRRYGRLLVLRRNRREVGRLFWVCRCDCGKEHTVRALHLKNSHVQSCGCLAAERASEANTKHGMSSHSVYVAWENMRQRCRNPANRWFHRYGGRGITICERWDDSAAFLADMLPTWQKGLTLDRIDNDGNYEPGNCRWVPQSKQLSNREKTIFIDWGGERLSIAELSERTGVRASTIRARYHKHKRGSDLIAPT